MTYESGEFESTGAEHTSPSASSGVPLASDISFSSLLISARSPCVQTTPREVLRTPSVFSRFIPQLHVPGCTPTRLYYTYLLHLFFGGGVGHTRGTLGVVYKHHTTTENVCASEVLCWYEAFYGRSGAVGTLQGGVGQSAVLC